MPVTQPMLTAGRVTFEEGKVGEAMHPGVITCPLETPLSTVARMMTMYRVHAIVVYGEPEVDGPEGNLWGVVSDLDLIAVAAAETLDDRTAGGSAATPVVSVGPDESLVRAAQLMAEHGTAHLVVVDQFTTRPVGVLSTLDLATVLAGARAPGS